MKTTDLIIEAAALLGNETKLAIACRVSQNAIWQAKKRGRVSGELAVPYPLGNRDACAWERSAPRAGLARPQDLQATEGAEGCWTRCKQRRSVDRLDEDHGC
jgi:hypothetical protein